MIKRCSLNLPRDLCVVNKFDLFCNYLFISKNFWIKIPIKPLAIRSSFAVVEYLKQKYHPINPQDNVSVYIIYYINKQMT